MRFLQKVLLYLSFPYALLFGSQSITYEFSGGRFGDNVLSYLHAKWLAYKYEMPLLYKPFPYSSVLSLDAKEKLYVKRLDCQEFKLTYYRPLPDFLRSSCIYVCPYFAEDPSDRWLNPTGYRFDMDWGDETFRKIAREMLEPKENITVITPPSSTINIAVHIREGGGFDTDHTRLWDPLKLPPIDFYIEALLNVLERFNGRSFYCYIFTDALNPSLLAVRLQQAVPKDISIEWDYRKKGNHHTANVLVDFFSFSQFDVLIRPQSNFSIVPSLIYDFAIVCSPDDFKRIGGEISITKITIKQNQFLYNEVLKRSNPSKLALIQSTEVER